MGELTVRPNNHAAEMALTFLGIFAGAVLCAVLLPRKYEAEMKILVNRERVDAVVTPDPDNANGPGMVPAVSEEDLNSEVELIKSRDLLERVVVACGLSFENKSAWRRWIERAENSVRGTPATPETQLAQAVQTLAERLVVDPMKKTTLIRVAYSARDPQLAALVLQTLATMYQEKHASVHRPPGTFRFFDQETQRYRDDLASAEAALTDFDSRQGIVEVTAQKRLVLEQLSQCVSGEGAREGFAGAGRGDSGAADHAGGENRQCAIAGDAGRHAAEPGTEAHGNAEQVRARLTAGDGRGNADCGHAAHDCAGGGISGAANHDGPVAGTRLDGYRAGESEHGSGGADGAGGCHGESGAALPGNRAQPGRKRN